MDDSTLNAQYAQSGDLMDLCNSEAGLRESAQVGDEDEVEAGLVMKEYRQQVSTLTLDQTQQLRQQMKVQSILFTALRHWMESWDLGAGFDDTYAIARRLVRNRLADPGPIQQSAIDRLLVEDIGPGSISQSAEQQAITILAEVFIPEDWQTMAEVASQSVALRVMNERQSRPQTPVA